jgi:hypothetical protein
MNEVSETISEALAGRIAKACAAHIAEQLQATTRGETAVIDLGPIVREVMGLPPLATEQEQRDHNGGYTIAEEQAWGPEESGYEIVAEELERRQAERIRNDQEPLGWYRPGERQ